MKIMLDAGHYGKRNQSPVLPEYYEAVQMWKLCEYLAEELRLYGFEVFATRTRQEKDLAVVKRGEAAKGCDIFISLHSNAVGNYASKTDRVEVYTPYDGQNSSRDLAQKLANAVTECMAVSMGKVKTKKSSKGDYEYYGVLRGARNVGVPYYYLIEHSFHTNENSARWLMNDDNLRRLAVAEAATVAEYFGMKRGWEPGDVNMDGRIDAQDAILVKRSVLNTLKLTPEQEKLADADLNGKVDSFDYIRIKRKFMTGE